ncbi:MAG: acetate kinase [Pseudomonadota bacterium]
MNIRTQHVVARRTLALAVSVALAGMTSIAPAQTAGLTDPELRDIERRLEETKRKLQELKEQLAEEQRRLEADRRALEAHRRQLDSELDRVAGRGVAPPATGEAKLYDPTAPGNASPEQMVQAQQGAPAGQAQRPAPVGEAPPPRERPEEPAQLFSEPTALTPRGSFVLEPAYQFIHSTDNRIALVGFAVIPAITIGLIDVRRVSRDIHTFSLTGRYGVTNRFEIEAKVPWVYATSSTVTRPLATPSVTDAFFDSDGSGIGDVEVAARYQLNEFRGDNAVYIGYLRYKSRTGEGAFEVPIDPATGLQQELPTGSGFHAVQPGITWLYPSDPAVFFGGLSYLYSFSRDVGNGFGEVELGGVIDISLGMGLALNERASFSIGYQHSIVGETDQRNPEDVSRVLAQTGTLQLGTMRFGLAYRLSPKVNMNLTLGIGVTDDSPDFEATVRFPFSF